MTVRSDYDGFYVVKKNRLYPVMHDNIVWNVYCR